MKKIKEFSKKYLIGFTLGLITSGIVVVCAATYFPSNQTTYDNSISGLNATNVQGAIDELYNTCFPSIIDQIVDSLEKDPYECRYFFKGANPNNYIRFNNELWRIISVECDGTIKIMRNDSIGKIVWDSSQNNNWARPASLNTYLNGTYYNSLSSTAQGQIAIHSWSIGSVSIWGENLDEQVNNENSRKWQGNIALPTLSEYFRTNSDTSCNNYEAIDDNIDCRNSTWMYNSAIQWWTLTPNGSNFVFKVSMSGSFSSYSWADGSNEIRPAIYLNSSVKITDGDGSQSNPYILS